MQPNRIRELREARGLSQPRLAQLITSEPGKPPVEASTVRKLEQGRRGLTLEWMRRIARVFGVRPSELLLDQDVEARLSTDEADLLRVYRGLNGRGKRRMLRVCAALADPVAEDEQPPSLAAAMPAERLAAN